MRPAIVFALYFAAGLVGFPLPSAGKCPELVGRWPYGETGAVAAEGDFAYFNRGAVLTVADVSTPDAPQVLGEIALPGAIRDLAVEDGFIFVAMSHVGLLIIDANNSTEPVEVGRVDMSNPGVVAAEGGYAFVMSYGSQWEPEILHVIDVVTPSAPIDVGSLMVPPGVSDLEASDSLVFVAGPGLRLIDVSVPAAPVELSVMGTPARDVAVTGDTAIVVGDQALRVIDVSSPTNPEVLGSIWHFYGYPHSVTAEGDFAYYYLPNPYSAWGDYLIVLDLSDPMIIVRRGTVEAPGGPLVVAGNHLLTAAYGNGLRVVGVADPDAPVEVGTLDGQPAIDRIAVSEGFMFATSRGNDLIVFDLSNLADPGPIARVPAPRFHRVCDLAVSEDFAYVVDAYDLRVFDVSAPAAPGLVGTLSLGPAKATARVEIDGDRALIFDRRYSGGSAVSSFIAVDIHAPSAPFELARRDLADDSIHDAEFRGLAYLATDRGLRIFDCDALQWPSGGEIGHFLTEGGFSSVAVTGDRAYVNSGILDISSPRDPAPLGTYPNPTKLVELSKDGRFVIGAEDGGLRVLDVTVPSAPLEVGLHHLYGSPTDLTISGDLAYVPIRDAGFDVYDISGCPPARATRRSGRRVIP